MSDSNSKFELDRSPYDFLKRIIESAPKDNTTLKELIGVGKVTYSKNPRMSAAVADTRPYTLIFGKDFMQDKMETMEDCVFVLWHELTHLVLDHFALDVREEFVEKGLGDKADTVLAEHATHIIVDCQVNATCYHTLKDDKYMELIKRMYPKEEMPHCFLRPDGEPPEEYRDAHKKLFSKDGITNEELIDTLLPWFKENEENLKEFIKDLLGNHKDMFKRASNPGGGSTSDELSDLIESVAKELGDQLDGPGGQEEQQGQGAGNEEGEEEEEGQGQGKEGEEEGQDSKPGENPGGKQAGKGGPRRRRMVQTVLDKIEHSRYLASKMKKSYQVSPSSRIYAAIESFNPHKSTRSVIPNFHDRRTVALYSRGHMPVFHMIKDRGSKVHVPCYIDVSGSQDHVVPHVIPVVSRLKRLVGNEVFCFSTYVSPTSINTFSKGEYCTSGGTNFNPVIEHILEKGFKKAIILTDGCASLSDANKKALKRRGVQIKVGWTEAHINEYPLKDIATETFYMFGNKDAY